MATDGFEYSQRTTEGSAGYRSPLLDFLALGLFSVLVAGFGVILLIP